MSKHRNQNTQLSRSNTALIGGTLSYAFRDLLDDTREIGKGAIAKAQQALQTKALAERLGGSYLFNREARANFSNTVARFARTELNAEAWYSTLSHDAPKPSWVRNNQAA